MLVSLFGPDQRPQPAPFRPGQDRRDEGRLIVNCPDRPGVVAAISRVLFEQGANIIHADQHSTAHGEGHFHMQVEFRLPDLRRRRTALESAFQPVASAFDMEWSVAYHARPKRITISVSQAEHALL